MSKPQPPYSGPSPYLAPSMNPGGQGGSSTTGLEFGEMFSHIFRSPDWFTNVLLCGVCFLIPIVGPIVLLGYRYEVMEHWNRQPNSGYPNFDFGKFSNYLNRGIWPFLVLFIGGFITIPLVLVAYVAFILCVAIASSLGPEAALIGSLVGFAVLIFGIVFSMALVGMISVPMELKAGTRQDFGAGFDVAFIKDFIRLTWKETLIGFVFLYFANFVLAIVGMMMLCIGVYFTMAISIMAQTHFEHQLYRLYLQRGGAPIPTPFNPAGQYPGRAPSGW